MAFLGPAGIGNAVRVGAALQIVGRNEEPRRDDVAVVIVTEAGDDGRQVGGARHVAREPARLAFKLVKVHFARALVIDGHIDEGRDAVLLPDAEMELAERLAVGGPLPRLAGELAQAFQVGIAMREAGVDGVPYGLVLPVAIARGFEDDRQE